MTKSMIEQVIEVDGCKWRAKAVSMKAVLNEIGHARCTGSVGSSKTLDNTLCGGGIELIAEVHRLDEHGNDVRASS